MLNFRTNGDYYYFKILTHMTIFVKYIHQKSKIKGYKEYKNANLLIHLKSLNYFLPIKNFV